MSRLTTNIQARRPWMLQSPSFSFGFTRAPEEEPQIRDIEIAARLIRAYRLAAFEKDGGADDVWAGFVEKHYADMLSLIDRGDPRALAVYLRALPRQGAGHGYFQGKATFDMMRASPAGHRDRALWLLDHLVGLAEALGVLRVRCPEQGDWETPPFESLERLCFLIEQKMSLPITMPKIFDGLFALQPGSAPIHLRSIMASYAAHQIVRLLKLLDGSDPTSLQIAEIGAGIGYTAAIAHQMGVGQYTIYDLPEVNVGQGFFLLQTVGEDLVSLFGETRKAPISVLPASAFDSTPQEFDATVNVDSLPEIDPKLVDDYLAGISKRSRYFFSINQEAPRTDPAGRPRKSTLESVSSHPGLEPVLRYPNWVRAGYVEELFRTRQGLGKRAS